MNKYIKQLIDKYEAQGLWDIRARNNDKAMLVPVNEWLSVFNDPTSHNGEPAYRINETMPIQGILINSSYFLYECTARYTGVVGYKEPVTFVLISPKSYNDVLGYHPLYVTARSALPSGVRKHFSFIHTQIACNMLMKYPNFNDIKSYPDFIYRYVGDSGASLCKRKGVFQALQLQLSTLLKDEIDFKQLEWEIYEDAPQQRPRFYLYTKTHLTCKEGITTKYSKVFLDGGLLL